MTRPSRVHRREHRTAGADHQPGLPAQHRQPAPVPRRRPQSGGQCHHRRLVDQGGRGLQQHVDVALVGNDRQHAVTAAHRGGGRLGQPVAPPLAGQRLPHRPRRAAIAQCLEELLTAGVARPARGIDGLDDRQQRRSAGRLLRAGMPRRDRQPQHIGAGAGVPGGDRVDEPAHLRGQHRLGGDHPVQPAQLTDVVGVGAAFEHERVDQPAVEPHPHPHAGLGVVGLLGGRPDSRTPGPGAAPTASAAPARWARVRRHAGRLYSPAPVPCAKGRYRRLCPRRRPISAAYAPRGVRRRRRLPTPRGAAPRDRLREL